MEDLFRLHLVPSVGNSQQEVMSRLKSTLGSPLEPDVQCEDSDPNYRVSFPSESDIRLDIYDNQDEQQEDRISSASFNLEDGQNRHNDSREGSLCAEEDTPAIMKLV